MGRKEPPPADPVEAHAGGQPGQRRAGSRALLWLWTPTLAFIVSRLGIALVALISEPLVVDSGVPPYHLRPENVLLDVFGSRWDTGFYLSIADEGYFFEGVELPSVAFFPLLPLLIRAVGVLTGDALLTGLLITNAALWGAAVLFYRLVAESRGERIAARAVWFLLIFPTSFFGSAIYSESLFLLCAVGALYLFRKGYWESAGLLGVLGALSRLMGLLIAPLLLVEWWSQRQESSPAERPSWAALLAPLAVPLGTGAYMLYQQRAFGDPLAFVHASAAWERAPSAPWATVGALFQRPAEGWITALQAGRLPLNDWIDLLFVLSFVALGIILLVQRRWSEGVFVLLGALIPFSSGLLMSQRRYMWVLFPAFALLGQWGENPKVERSIYVLFSLGLSLFTTLFANWYWVA